MQPVNRRVEFVFSIFRLFHKQFTFPPLILGENDIVLIGDSTDLLKSIGINGKILYTPGHSRDSISVILSDGSAFVGDVAMNFLRLTRIEYRPIYVEDINAVYESWRRLVEQGAKSSSAGESHPHALTEPDVTVSRHPALTTQPWPERSTQ
jgi:glyoxylase-like metal-dependent hydrolase (beta-lactamase superfamily II)